ncbi:hypothetical protein C8J56DRAFT_1039031 [Mycena floridula]|nr:hypothetical protein C8J56DRAFT_1039031 [Mycena floridula]
MGSESSTSGNPFVALTASNKVGEESVGINTFIQIPSVSSSTPSSDTSDEMAIDPQQTLKKLEMVDTCVQCSKDKDRMLALLEELHQTEKTHHELLETHLSAQTQLMKLDLAHSLLHNDYDRIRSKLSHALEECDDLRQIIDNKERTHSVSPKQR